LLHVGKVYDPSLAAETERNLRAFGQLSVVLLVPIQGSTADTVRVLVVTKDVWSLRVSWQPSCVNGKLTSLSLAPAENNLFGTTQTVAGTFFLDPNNYFIGGRYYVPRIGGSRIRASVGGNAIFNCATNELEGAMGDLTYGQPLYSSHAKWSWQTAMTWSSSVVRGVTTREDLAVCDGGRSGPLSYPTSPFERSRTLTAETTFRPNLPDDTGNVMEPLPTAGVPVVEQNGPMWERDQYTFPSEYRYERLRGQFVLTRSFNIENKVNVSTGAEVDYRASSREPPSADDVSRERVQYEERTPGLLTRIGEEELPPDQTLFNAVERAYLDPRTLRPRERRISPYAQVHAFSNSYRRIINYSTLGLQEDIQVGHDVYLRLYPALQPLSTRDMFGAFASAAYTGHYRGGFGRVLASSQIEYGGPGKSDVSLRASAHFATPDVGVGRFVYDFSAVQQPMQYLSGLYLLGGTGRLRGYHPGKLLGAGLATFNHEFRSRPLRLFSVLTGLAVFHDVGTVFDGEFEGGRLRQGAGAGLRILFPQLDRDVFRIDFGFPILPPGSPDSAAEFTFVASFYQAFSAPVAPPPVLLPQ
jgi:hypothetical protein